MHGADVGRCSVVRYEQLRQDFEAAITALMLAAENAGDDFSIIEAIVRVRGFQSKCLQGGIRESAEEMVETLEQSLQMWDRRAASNLIYDAIDLFGLRVSLAIQQLASEDTLSDGTDPKTAA
jgi:hypothetical protein